MADLTLALAQMRCEKGDWAGNLAQTETLLAQAQAAGCAVIVFPEAALSGYADYRRFPAAAQPLDSPLVRAAVAPHGALQHQCVVRLLGTESRRPAPIGHADPGSKWARAGRVSESPYRRRGRGTVLRRHRHAGIRSAGGGARRFPARWQSAPTATGPTCLLLSLDKVRGSSSILLRRASMGGAPMPPVGRPVMIGIAATWPSI